METIYRAAVGGDAKFVTKMLNRDPDLCVDDAKFTSFSRTLLHIAAMHGHVELATAILRLSTQVATVTDSQGFTPLHLASTRSNTTMVQMLLDANIDACTTLDQDGRTPLHLAAMRGEVKVMELLMKNIPEAIFQVTNDRETILHLCVKHDKLQALKKLVDYLVYAHGPNCISVNSKDIAGNTILHLAAERRQIKMIKYLLQKHNLGVEINVLNNNNLKALHLLAQNEKDDIEIGYFDYLRESELKASSNKQRPDERVNVLMVVAVLIAGIAFQAVMDPPGGVFQDESKVYSNIDPVTFSYYLNSAINTSVIDNFSYYLQNLPQQATIRNGSNGGSNMTTATNSGHFVKALLDSTLHESWKSYYTHSVAPGIVLDEDKWSNIISNHNSTINGSAAKFFPYLIRYAGTAILAYKYPVNYQVYMTSNALAFLLSLSIIILVVSGAIRDQSIPQVRFLSILMVISIGCIVLSYLSVFQTMSPPFHIFNSPLVPYTFIWITCFFLSLISMIWKRFRARSELCARFYTYIGRCIRIWSNNYASLLEGLEDIMVIGSIYLVGFFSILFVYRVSAFLKV